jgi:hypothetical protein
VHPRPIALPLCLVGALLLGGCVRWATLGEVPTAEPALRQEFTVWVGNRHYRVHGLRLSADSVSAVPYLQPPSCDSCRLAFSRRDITSIQVQEEAQFRTALVFAGVAVVGGVAMAVSGIVP